MRHPDIARTRTAQRRALLAGLVLAAGAGLGLAPAAAATQPLPDFVELIEKVAPAVVNIRTTERIESGARSPFRRRLPQGEEVPRGEGSGFIISADGYVVTNAHVVDGASEVLVTLPDKREFKAKIVGADARTDVALVKVDATGLPTVRIGDVSRLRVGEWVLAIGSPFGLDSTVTAGIVSAKHRDTGSDIPFLQTDVAVNPGNSGGPLISTRGEVVGVNSQISSETRSNSGIGFAVPSDLTRRVAAELIETGTVNYSYIGIQGRDLRLTDAEALGLANNVRGVVVTAVFRDGPAAAADLRPATLLQNNREDISAADIIVGINGEHLLGFDTLISYLAKYTVPGDTITLNVLRGGQPVDVPVTLAPRPAQ